MAINADSLREAQKQADIFSRLVELALDRLAAEGETEFLGGSKETGAVRRVSMDLTRELARLRRP